MASEERAEIAVRCERLQCSVEVRHRLGIEDFLLITAMVRSRFKKE